MKITAVLAIRNEEAYLANCLRHLVQNEVNFAIIDNGSSDSTPEIYRRAEFAASLVDVREQPYCGSYSWADLLRRKMTIAEAVDADWIVNLDADEIMHSYRDGESLREALCRLDSEGWNVVNFDEFVFLPVEASYVSDVLEHQPIAHYYFFQPNSPRLMRAWRKASGLSMVESGGHVLTGDDVRLAPEHLALRHYIVRNQEHAFTKYSTRIFAPEDLARGWHRARANQSAEAFAFPPASLLKRLDKIDKRDLDRSEPWTAHYWQRSQAWGSPRDLRGAGEVSLGSHDPEGRLPRG
jgi:glycosyltransferase involved in cell wall biosynthesis